MSSQNLSVQPEQPSLTVTSSSERPADLIIANRDGPEPDVTEPDVTVPVEQSSPPSECKLSLCIKIK